jgi:hypothetical protein
MMPILSFAPTLDGQTAAFATPDPKNITFIGNGFEVRTGSDYIPPRPDTPDEADAKVARSNGKLAALAKLTPAQVQAWVNSNVTTLADAKDVITTLAVAVSVLARRL